jgi:hypothetical protein
VRSFTPLQLHPFKVGTRVWGGCVGAGRRCMHLAADEECIGYRPEKTNRSRELVYRTAFTEPRLHNFQCDPQSESAAPALQAKT